MVASCHKNHVKQVEMPVGSSDKIPKAHSRRTDLIAGYWNQRLGCDHTNYAHSAPIR